MFSEKKVAQMAAFFIANEPGGHQATLKLMKLLYLADRESLQRHGHPISFDLMGSMNQGPVLSRTLDYIHGEIEASEDGWDQWVSDAANYEVNVRRKPAREDLSELSDADMDVLQTVWNQFGHMNKWQIRDYTHENCGEWKHPGGGFIPIRYEDVFLALGKTREQANELENDLRLSNRFERIFARL
jgi:uncharacterized phage-associated protein